MTNYEDLIHFAYAKMREACETPPTNFITEINKEPIGNRNDRNLF